ncbi:hypothetical protein ACVWW4_006624 [Bradyrhizobium sp. LB7.1]
MTTTLIADVDRQIKVLDGLGREAGAFARVSDLRALPFVVLLGEPGIGKSTVLAAEAAREGAPMITVRELMTGTVPVPGAPLFLDALDEYRTDGGAEDKVHTLANTIASHSPDRWRLTCRSEDWRKAADIGPIAKTAAGRAIAVVQLLPLGLGDAASILRSLGEHDPEGFLRTAESYGATGFTESPLGLKLLHSAVADGGEWPTNRFQLFSGATRRLAFEQNAVRSLTVRHSVDSILDTAADAFLLLLASGTRAIWRSNLEPPTSRDVRAYLTADDIKIERDLLGDMLDTPLFRGEGVAFEPMHKTIAEFLAARTLAVAVRGDRLRPALPLSRALAMITGSDYSPPTELRGLFAWFAAHLAADGNDQAALTLIERDAVSVLSYGDAAAFDTTCRRAMLQNLDRDDPYFRASEVGVTSVGGLAGEDLASDFAAVLVDDADESHRRHSVFEALTIGKPVCSLRPLLRSIVLQAERPEWQRRRALEAFLNGERDAPAICRELFDALSSEAPSGPREAIRAELASRFARGALTVADVRSILVSYRSASTDNMMGRFYRLLTRVETEPLPGLFDEAMRNWLQPTEQRGEDRDHHTEISQVLDHALASAIRLTPELPAARLWRWICNVRRDPWSSLKERTAEALKTWLDAEPQRQVDLFAAVLAGDDPQNGPWVIPNQYSIVANRRPSDEVVALLLSAAVTEDRQISERLLSIAVEIVRRVESLNQFWTVYDCVTLSENDELLSHLRTSEVPEWKRIDAIRQSEARSELEQQRVSDVADLRTLLPDVSAGRHAYSLGWAAEIYFEHDGSQDIARVVARTDEATASAIVEGWRRVVLLGLGDVDAAALGRAEAEQRRFHIEAAAAAGVLEMITSGDASSLAAAPLEIAIAVLKSSWIVDGEQRRDKLDAWAISRLNAEPDRGAAQLLAYWGAALDAGASDLPSLWKLQEAKPSSAVVLAVESILKARPNMVIAGLRSAVRAAAKLFDTARLVGLAREAVNNLAVRGGERRIWMLVIFVLAPVIEAEEAETVSAVLDEGNRELVGTLTSMKGVNAAPTLRLTISILGRTVAPRDERPRRGRVSDTYHQCETVRKFINLLSADPSEAAATALSALLSDPQLGAWVTNLRHAQAQQRRTMRDKAFRHPSPSAVRAALDCGPPVNALDLRAIIVSELLQLRAELRSTDTTPWKRYWNNSRGKVTEPLIENECRDHLLDRLRDRLTRYYIAAALPESRRGNDTRTDVLILTGAGRNLPIEIKRHFHPAIWTAASTQLVGYAADPGADCMGIYLVLWFGTDISTTPARPDGGAGPKNAAELETMLVADMPEGMKTLIEVVVFDVSNPARLSPRRSRKSARK